MQTPTRLMLCNYKRQKYKSTEINEINVDLLKAITYSSISTTGKHSMKINKQTVKEVAIISFVIALILLTNDHNLALIGF